MTPYALRHEFPGLSPRQLLETMASADHQALQDRRAKVARRETIDRVNDETLYRCESRVFPERQLPAFARPFIKGGLEYYELVTWHKSTNVLDVEVQPAVLGGRSRLRARAQVIAEGTTAVRIYEGQVEVALALVGGRIEKGIVADLSRTMDEAAALTRELVAAKRI